MWRNQTKRGLTWTVFRPQSAVKRRSLLVNLFQAAAQTAAVVRLVQSAVFFKTLSSHVRTCRASLSCQRFDHKARFCSDPVSFSASRQPVAPLHGLQEGAPDVSRGERRAHTYVLSSQLFPKLRFTDSSCSSHQMNSTILVGFNQ